MSKFTWELYCNRMKQWKMINIKSIQRIFNLNHAQAVMLVRNCLMNGILKRGDFNYYEIKNSAEFIEFTKAMLDKEMNYEELYDYFFTEI